MTQSNGNEFPRLRRVTEAAGGVGVPYFDANGDEVVLPVGADDDVLSIGGGVPVFVAPATVVASVGRLEYLLDAPRTPPASPNAQDEEWNDGTGMSGTGNGLDASWAATGGGLQSIAYASNSRAIITVTGGASPGLAGYVKTQPATPYTVTCEVALLRHTYYNMCSLGFFDGTKFWVFQLYQDPVTDTDEYRRAGLLVARYSNLNTRVSTNTPVVIASRQVWLQVTNDGSNCIAKWSPTGTPGSYETIATESYATALLTPTKFFVGLDAFGLTTAVGEFGPVRVT